MNERKVLPGVALALSVIAILAFAALAVASREGYLRRFPVSGQRVCTFKCEVIWGSLEEGYAELRVVEVSEGCLPHLEVGDVIRLTLVEPDP